QPTISWSTTTTVPSSGRALAAPEFYRVIVFRFTLDSSTNEWRTRKTIVANLSTPSTSMTLPAGILSAGGVYAIFVESGLRDATVGISPLQEPNRHRYPETTWQVASAPFTP